MTDSQAIETAYRLIEGFVGEGDALPTNITTAELRARVQAEWPDHADDLDACGEWSIGIALARYLRVAA